MGKLLFYATINQPMLSVFDKFYKVIPLRRLDLLSISPHKDPQFTPITVQITELKRIISIAPLSFVSLYLPFLPSVLSFDASHIASSVVKTSNSSQFLSKLFSLAALHLFTKDKTPFICRYLDNFFSSHHWTTVIHHVWRHHYLSGRSN